MSLGLRDFIRVPSPAAITTAATFGGVPGLGGFTRSDASGRGSGRSRSRRGQGPARVELEMSSNGGGIVGWPRRVRQPNRLARSTPAIGHGVGNRAAGDRLDL